MNLTSLLTRIGLPSLPDSSLARLQALHEAMTRTIPFENLAILEGKAISLEPASLHAKVVEQRRGGYCFELNALLAGVLESLGYTVERLIGRVWVNGAPAPPLTHMTLRVPLDGQAYLCDVGFGGGGLRKPLPWETGAAVQQGPDRFRLQETDNGETMLERLGDDGAWKSLYSLLPCTMRRQDYIPANHYTSTHPDSSFTQGPIAALATDDGRITLRGRVFRHVGADGAYERELASFEELAQVLSGYFGLINLDLKALERRLSGLFRP